MPRKSWTNFLLHASKVQKIVINDNNPLPDLRALSAYRPTLHLFPSLRDFEWDSGSREAAMYASLFISQSLRSVRITGYGSSPEACCVTTELIRSVAYNAPGLRSLCIHGSTDTSSNIVDPTLSQLCASFTQLKEFSTDLFLSSTTLQCLGALPNLTSLSCCVNGTAESISPPSNGERLFSAVRTLCLSWSPPFTPHGVLASFCNSPLRKLELHQRSPLSLNELRHLVVALQSLPPLVDLHIANYSLSSLPATSYASALQPLSSPRLQILNIPAAPFRINDDCVKAIARDFPGLIELKLDNELDIAPMTGSRGLVTFSGLLAVAAGCPNLRTLRLPIYFHGVSRDHLTQRPLRQFQSLLEVEAAITGIPNPPVLAAVLSGIFPNAYFSTYGCVYHGETLDQAVESWKEVIDNMELFKMARQQMLDP